ncbi:MAG TPA: VCBS repeat-containing protein [Blastocatellia bacterium]|nr:VCBS repeat-containing protein [Blastocatellia bacterium]
MEKNTREDSLNRDKQKRSAIVGRLMVATLLVSGVVTMALPGSVRPQAESQPSYSTATFSAGASPSAAKVRDLDGDGLNDIAVVNSNGSLQLFFNKGAGSLERVSLSGLWPSSSKTLDLDIGDLNGDGRNDIAVAFSTPTGAVSVLLNQGNRTFAPPVNYDVCNSSNGVVIGDLDQDGHNDLADISQCSKAGVLLNNGHGNFAFMGTYGAGSASRSISLMDLNRDGFKDIAYVNTGDDSITVMLNNRNGTFGEATWYYVGDLPNDLATGDLNGDGIADIAVAVSYYSEVFILFGDGNGGFFGYSEVSAGDSPSSIAIADLDKDGFLDLAVASWGTGRLSVLLNRGDYSFAGPTAFSVGQNPADIATGDLDGDSVPDLVAVNQGSGTITVLLTAAGATPSPPPSQITLTLSTRMTKQARLVDLKWSGASGSSVDIYRNGSRVATVSNTGSYIDQLDKRAKGTFTYKVCAAGTQTCSNQAAVSF